MKTKYLSTVIQLLILVAIQVILLNHLRIYRYFMPIIYLYPLLKLPIRTDHMFQILLGAIVGIVVDLFMNTPGLNMFSATLVMYVRPRVLNLFLDDDLEETDNAIPSYQTMHAIKYIFSTFFIVLVHISSLYLLEACSVLLFTETLPYILGSTAISLPVYLILDSFFVPQSR